MPRMRDPNRQLPRRPTLSSFPVDGAMLGSVDVPVLCIAGDKDAFFPHPDDQAKLFTGSPEAKAVVLPGTGHAVTLEKSAPEFRRAMADWLRAHKFAAR
ncbi:MAG: alpha/beta fold hydrolase [Gammaproteobacteria bacterium]